MSASSGILRGKNSISALHKHSENPRFQQKSSIVQRSTTRRALGDLSNVNGQQKQDTRSLSNKKAVKCKTDDLDEIESGPPPESDDKWVEPPYFKALTTILSGSLIKQSGDVSTANIFPEPEIDKSRRRPYTFPQEIIPTSCSPVIDISEINHYDIDEDFHKYID